MHAPNCIFLAPEASGMPGGCDGGVGPWSADQDDKIWQTVHVGPGTVEPCAGHMAMRRSLQHDGVMPELHHNAVMAMLHHNAVTEV